mmetsp:Transcript_19972/g.41756  ORF Transcript_19972/g.41756 Transcript_19972/m.41756 type:complete len:308 (-) Transcript_19972:1003-1926(-)|eukprot:CAMPEP_0118634194 /NCGR_PEP_ID=MMETSP0785-20121206/1406_1 /TAXON_ID=91992 /ORGANISM="Bolidomonas pacifica, Strain CCMP 1866" /LENGTH=307 /DNA_ID=CAMNT_0006525131 /DNA_START=56 /DNA_END=979 /DNA_ORIENTATION=+
MHRLSFIALLALLPLISSLSTLPSHPSHPDLFGGLGRLYQATTTPQNTLARLQSANVLVVGIGGVGSWVAEGLSRSGVGSIALCDLDDVCVSNINRQVQALVPNVGKMKVDALSDHLLTINPSLQITKITDFATASNIDTVFGNLEEFDVVVDCIDDARDKAAIINKCQETNTTVVTVGGGAGLRDPTQIRVKDITKAGDDKLLFWVRKHLRQKYGFPGGPKPGEKNNHRPKKWGVWAISSEERSPPSTTPVTSISATGGGSLRRCDSSLGTAVFTTGALGFVAASKVVDMIVHDELTKIKAGIKPS